MWRSLEDLLRKVNPPLLIPVLSVSGHPWRCPCLHKGLWGVNAGEELSPHTEWTPCRALRQLTPAVLLSELSDAVLLCEEDFFTEWIQGISPMRSWTTLSVAGFFYVYEEEGFLVPLLKFTSTLSDAAEVSMMYSINMSLWYIPKSIFVQGYGLLTPKPCLITLARFGFIPFLVIKSSLLDQGIYWTVPYVLLTWVEAQKCLCTDLLSNQRPLIYRFSLFSLLAFSCFTRTSCWSFLLGDLCIALISFPSFCFAWFSGR